MDGIILVDKEKNMTSRDVVNVISKKLGTKKVGHTGTLDPIATGLMVICVNKGTKLVELLTDHDKSYIATVKLGLKTDTYDITGNILEENYDYQIKKEELERVLNSFVGKYMQEVPIYSSIKINGKKLYEYARSNIEVELPKRLVEIYDIKLLDFNDNQFTFSVSVSKGTYIRSLINDISKKMNILMTMSELRRTIVGKFNINNAKKLNDIMKNDILPITEIVDFPVITVDDNLEKKIRNGMQIDDIYNSQYVLFINDKNEELAMYEKADNNKLKSYRGF